MFQMKSSYFPSFSPFRLYGKPLPPTNLHLISRSFDENLLFRLKTLIPTATPPSINLSWLSLALDFLSSTYAEAESLVSDLQSSGLEKSFASYLNENIKVLDVCNSIKSEIHRFLQAQLLIKFALILLQFPCEARQFPAPENLRRARNTLSDWGNFQPGYTNLSHPNPEVLIRGLALGLVTPPRGNITTVDKLLQRTIYAVGAVTVFVAGVVVAALTGLPEAIHPIKVPGDFIWAEAFNGLESAVSGEFKRVLLTGERRWWAEDLKAMELRILSVCDVIDDVAGGEVCGSVVGEGGDKAEKLKRAVKELGTVTEAFSEGLDGLYDSLHVLFHKVFCMRNSVMEYFRAGLVSNKQGK